MYSCTTPSTRQQFCMPATRFGSANHAIGILIMSLRIWSVQNEISIAASLLFPIMCISYTIKFILKCTVPSVYFLHSQSYLTTGLLLFYHECPHCAKSHKKEEKFFFHRV